MLSAKISLNQFSNVYNCLWAANLDLHKSCNPFYIGNLLQTPFSEILDHLTQYASTLDRTRCFVRDCAHSLCP